MEKQVIVTGGTGVTGNALIRHLLSKETAVTAVIRPRSQRLGLLASHPLLKVVECPLKELGTLKNKLEKGRYQAFYHLGWEGSHGVSRTEGRNQMRLQLDNAGYVLEAVELCREVECPVFIGAGSQAEYGCSHGMVDEETECRPENGYGIAKVCAREMAWILCKKYKIRLVWARLFSVYGPCDGTRSMIDQTIVKLLKGESPDYTEAVQRWNYLYSADAAKALELLGLEGEREGIYCVANPESRPLYEYIKTIHQVVAPEKEPRFGIIPYENGRMVELAVNTDKLCGETGFKPTWSFRQGIGVIRDWYVTTGGVLGNGELL